MGQSQTGHNHPGTLNTEMTIRRIDLTDEGREAIARLSELDSSEVLEGPVLGLEVEGSLLAAISLTNGELVSDPFSRTAELRSLLKLRAAQHGRSMEAEHREILRQALQAPLPKATLKALLSAIPPIGDETDFERIQDRGREVEL